MSLKFANNAASTLTSSITAGATSLTVQGVDAASFPSLSGSEYFYATLSAVGVNGREFDWEVVRVTAVASNTFTVMRGEDGTAAQSWPADTRIELRITAAILNELSDKYSQAEVDAAIAGATPDWASLTGKPATFPPSAHTHTKAQITDLNDGDYATAAQGAKADSALQPGGNVSDLANDAGYLTPATAGGGGLTVETISVSTLAEVGKHYHVDTAGVVVTLPSSPSAGDQVAVSVDNFGDVVIERNGKNIAGLANDFSMDVSESYVLLRYVGAAEGWAVAGFTASTVGGERYEESIDAQVWEEITSFDGSSTDIELHIPRPELYERIEIVGTLRSSRVLTVDSVYSYLNGDFTDTNYFLQALYVENGTSSTPEVAEPRIGYCTAAQSPANATGTINIVIESPSVTRLQQVIGSSWWTKVSGTDAGFSQYLVHHDSATAPITQINLRSGTGDTLAGKLLVRGLRRRTIGNKFVSHNPSVDNLIINGDFRVNQRNGTRTPGVGVYGFDRWKGHANGLEQVVEGVGLPSGSLCLSWTGGGTGSINGGAAAVSPVVISSYAGNANISVVVPNNATEVKLEYGAVPTAFKPRLYGEELALCQRYYTRLSYESGDTVGVGAEWDNGNHYYAINLPVTLRADPTTGHSGALTVWANGTSADPSSVAIDASSSGKNAVEMRTISSRSETSVWARVKIGQTFYIEADAEL